MTAIESYWLLVEIYGEYALTQKTFEQCFTNFKSDNRQGAFRSAKKIGNANLQAL